MMNQQPPSPSSICGDIVFPSTWQVLGPFGCSGEKVPGEWLHRIPDELTVDGVVRRRAEAVATRGQYDFVDYFGEPPYDYSQRVLVYVPLESQCEQEVHLGFGGDWYLQAWLNGEEILNLMQAGTGMWPPAIYHYTPLVRLREGHNLLVVCLIHGKAAGLLALGGPAELRAGNFESIVPVMEPLNGVNIFERYSPDPQAPVRWAVPAGFDPRLPDLGLPELTEAKHRILYRARRGNAPIEEGGSGLYDGLVDGTWNHNLASFQFQDRVLIIWDNHALDENGPGSRVLAKVGNVVSEQGDVDWDQPESLVELAPQPVLVRRRKLISDRDRIRGAQAKGRFVVHKDRLFFVGHLSALHGVYTSTGCRMEYLRVGVIPDGNFFWGRGPECPEAGFARIDLKYRFVQEWGVRDDVFQPLSPLYCAQPMPDLIPITPTIALPGEPLLPPYADAPSIVEADAVVQEAYDQWKNRDAGFSAGFAPGTLDLAADGRHALAHGTMFTRRDGSTVVLREYLRPKQEPLFWATAKGVGEQWYPPARRTNIFGAVNPDGGNLPDGSNYLILNSPNRRTMYLTVSKDGRTFDRSWFLLHIILSDYTPGEMKRQGGPGAGPQYFVSQVIGNRIWIGYSISKEHIGLTEVPIDALAL